MGDSSKWPWFQVVLPSMGCPVGAWAGEGRMGAGERRCHGAVVSAAGEGEGGGADGGVGSGSGGVAAGRVDSSAACVARVSSTSCRAVNRPSTWPCLSSQRCWRWAGASSQWETAATTSRARPATTVNRAAIASPRQPCQALSSASGAPVDTASAREAALIGTTRTRRRRDDGAWNALLYGTWVPPRARGRTEGQAGSGGFFPRSGQDSFNRLSPTAVSAVHGGVG